MHFIPNIQCFEEFFQKPVYFFQKFYFSRILIDPIYFFDQSKLCLKFYGVFVHFDQSKLIFNQSKIVNKVFKNKILTYSTHLFQKISNFSLSLSLSPTRQGSTANFCHFPPNFLQGFSLHKPVCPYYPFFCIVFHVFMHYFMFFLGKFSDYA